MNHKKLIGYDITIHGEKQGRNADALMGAYPGMKTGTGYKKFNEKEPVSK